MTAQPKLAAVSGPLRGQTFDLGEDEICIGRIDADFKIDHMSVSKRHCVIGKAGSLFRVKDLDSLNGTFVNGERVEERVLQHGDRIMVGNTGFVFLTDEEDLSSLLGDVPLSDDDVDLTATVAIHRDDNVYLHPERTLAGAADPAVVRGYAALLKLATSETVRSSKNLAALQEQVLELIMDVIPARGGAILLTGSQPDQFASIFGKTPDGSPMTAISRTVVARVLKDRTALLCNDVTEAMQDNRSLILSEARSVLCVPLLSGDRAIGAIYLISIREATLFDESHLQLLTAMAAMLSLPLEKARQLDWLESENRRLQTDIDESHQLIGDSAPMKDVRARIARAAKADSTALILGESGTGKELVARALHRMSPRAQAPFVAINCATLKEELLESELFGHEKGSFTGAVAQKKGKFEIAEGGTVFLDEVAEMEPKLQVKLLRVIEEREFDRIGGTRPIKLNVRVIAATNQNLKEAITQGRFREELYWRLDVLEVTLPPLRQRSDDILMLANYFAARYASRYNSRIRGISPEAAACLKNYDWPGNVRELQNAIERAVVLGETDMILTEDLPESIIDSRPNSLSGAMGFHESVRKFKRTKIQAALDQTGGNHAEAAKLLGINRTYLHRLTRNLDLG
jgi:Nif-specific regulatory protein